VISRKTSEEHLRHINLIFNKLTTAGFTINALKCKFYQPQMNIFGHVMGPEALSADPQDRSDIQPSGTEKSKTLATIFRHLRNL
jgi:hypothetical protein